MNQLCFNERRRFLPTYRVALLILCAYALLFPLWTAYCTGGAVTSTVSARRSDKNSWNGTFLQLEPFRTQGLVDYGWPGLETVLAEVLRAQERESLGDPFVASSLYLLFPF